MSRVNQRKVQQAVRLLLEAVGEDPQREGLRQTPQRVARFWQEWLSVPAFRNTSFSAERMDELIVLRGIHTWSLCEHHLLPFQVEVSVGYLPVQKAIGVSKLARIVQKHCRRLQMQERLTYAIAEDILQQTAGAGAGAIVKGQHLCMLMRGARAEGSVMVTSALLGAFRDDALLREEFFRLIRA